MDFIILYYNRALFFNLGILKCVDFNFQNFSASLSTTHPKVVKFAKLCFKQIGHNSAEFGDAHFCIVLKMT